MFVMAEGAREPEEDAVRGREEERAAEQVTGQACSRERAPGRQPELDGPISGQLGAPSQWPGRRSPRYRSVNSEK